MGQIFSLAGAEFIQSTGRPERAGKARRQPAMVVVAICASDKEDAGPAVEGAEGDVPPDLFRKGRDGGILADEFLSDCGDEYAHGLVMSEGVSRHEVCLFRKGLMGVWASAAVTRFSLLQSVTLLSSPRPHRSGLATSVVCFVLFGICLVLPYTYPGAFPSFFLGIVSSGVFLLPFLTGANTAMIRQNAGLKPASQAPQLRRLLAGARHSICDRMIACPMDAITEHQLRNGSRFRCCALSNCNAVGGEARFPRALIALFAAGWHSTICQTSMTTCHYDQ